MGRILITGGTGLIGRRLVAALAAGGHQPVVLTRHRTASAASVEGARAVAWDGRTAEGWGELADGAQAIVHLAGESVAGRWTAARKRAIRDSRVESTQAVVEAVRRARVRPLALVQASAVGYYGDTGDRAIREGDPPGSDFLAGVCREWEHAGEPVEALGVRRPILRSGVVLSSRGGVLPQIALPFRWFLGGTLGDGRQTLSWVHVDDEVEAIRFLIEREDLAGPFHVTAPRPVTNAELAKTLGRVLRRPSWMRVPPAALRLALGEGAAAVLASCKALPQRLEAAGFHFRFREIEPALTDLLG